MSIELTSMWIWTYGFEKRWTEAGNYAKAFQAHGINGESLPTLTNEKLERIGVAKNTHRMAILSKINQLFPLDTVGGESSFPSSPEMDLEESPSNGYESDYSVRPELSTSLSPMLQSEESSINCSESLECEFLTSLTQSLEVMD